MEKHTAANQIPEILIMDDRLTLGRSRKPGTGGELSDALDIVALSFNMM